MFRISRSIVDVALRSLLGKNTKNGDVVAIIEKDIGRAYRILMVC